MLGVSSEIRDQGGEKIDALSPGKDQKITSTVSETHAGIDVSLLPFVCSIATHEWHAEASDSNKSDHSKLQIETSIEVDLSFQNLPILIAFTSQKASSASTTSQYAVPKEPQDCFREPRDNPTLPQTKTNLELFLCIALMQLGHAPTQENEQLVKAIPIECNHRSFMKGGMEHD
jgi:hypothetical protein